jgi:hypothetical protein
MTVFIVQMGHSFNIGSLLRGPFIIPLGYKKFGTPLDAFCGSYPRGYIYLTNPLVIIAFSLLDISLKPVIFAIFFKSSNLANL